MAGKSVILCRHFQKLAASECEPRFLGRFSQLGKQNYLDIWPGDLLGDQRTDITDRTVLLLLQVAFICKSDKCDGVTELLAALLLRPNSSDCSLRAWCERRLGSAATGCGCSA